MNAATAQPSCYVTTITNTHQDPSNSQACGEQVASKGGILQEEWV